MNCGRLLRKFDAGLSATSLLVAAQFLVAPITQAQTFLPMGPSPSSGVSETVQSRDAPPNGTVSGAAQSIIVSPVAPNTLFLGTVNGGVWSSNDGGLQWTPLTDKQRSLSISSLAFDPTDATARTLIAGIGITSNTYKGGLLTGLLYSTNAGVNWQEVTVSGAEDKNIVGVAARGDVILAASADPHRPGISGGLYRSVNRGATFSRLDLGAPDAAASVTALAGDPTNQTLLYAAQFSSSSARNAVYASRDGGLTWGAEPVLTLEVGQRARLATGPNGAVLVAAIRAMPDEPANDQLQSLMLSRDAGLTWSALTVPDAVKVSGQAATNLAIAIDPGNTAIVYVAGASTSTPNRQPDGTELGFAAPAYRVSLAADGTSQAEPLILEGTADNSFPHPDARSFAFDAQGSLLMVGDGGVYMRSSPQTNMGKWTGLNHQGLSLREAYAVAFDSVTKRLIVAAQDTGVAIQNSASSQDYTAVAGADGVNALVNDKAFADASLFYYSYQNLSALQRRKLDRSGRELQYDAFLFVPDSRNVLGLDATDFTEERNQSLPFFSKVVLNRQDPTRLAVGTNFLYTTTDDGSQAVLSLTKIGQPTQSLSRLAYGTRDNANAIIAGGGGGLSTYDGATFVANVASYPGTNEPTALVFDPRNYHRFYVADASAIRQTNDFGSTFLDLTANFSGLNLASPQSLEFISNNGVNALVVGGLSNVAPSVGPIAVADSNALGALSGWRLFGNGLPNAPLNVLSYNDAADTLVASSLGRGVWLLYDLTTYFDAATILHYGLANNDSSPDASVLSNGHYSSRDLKKSGSGILTINGTTTYSGKTDVLEGRLDVQGRLTSSSMVNVSAVANLSGTGTLPTTNVAGSIQPGNSIGTLTVAGNFSLNGGTIAAELQGPLQDRISVSGNVTAFTGSATLSAYGGGSPFPGFVYTILSAPNSLDFATSSSLSLDQSGLSSALLREGTTLVQAPLGNAKSFAVQWRPNHSVGATTAAMLAMGHRGLNVLGAAGGLDRSFSRLIAAATDDANATGDAVGFTGFTTGQAAASGLSSGFVEALANLTLLQSNDQLVDAVNSLSAQPYAAYLSVGLETLKQQRESVLAQSGHCLDNGWIVNGKKTKQPLCAFALAQNSTTSVLGNADLASYDDGVFSSGFGLEYHPSKRWSFGTSYGYGTTYASDFSSQSATIRSGVNSVSLFTHYRPSELWSVRGLVGYSTLTSSATRSIAYIGGDQPLTASPNGHGMTAALEADYSIVLTKPSAAMQALIKPLLGFAWGGYQQGSFQESGNALALSVNAATANSFVTTAGLEATTSPLPLNRSRTISIRPTLQVAYQLDALASDASNQTVTYTFVEAPAVCASCSAQGQNMGTNALTLSGGLDVQLSRDTSLYVNATYLASNVAGQFGYGGGLRYRF